jgi:hypothetical protein
MLVVAKHEQAVETVSHMDPAIVGCFQNYSQLVLVCYQFHCKLGLVFTWPSLQFFICCNLSGLTELCMLFFNANYVC